MDEKLGVAVIGLGIGRRHIQAFQAVPGIEVVAVASSGPAAREKARREFNISYAYSDYREAVAREDVHLVSICTPDRLHAEQALFALEEGKHVLCEKPIATSAEDAARLAHKVQETGLKFLCGHNYRFIPQFRKVKELMDAGTLDPVFLAESNYITSFRFANGHIGRVLLLLGAQLKEKFYVDVSVYGYQGMVKAVMQRNEVIVNVGGAQGDKPQVIPIPAEDSIRREIEHFVDCVRMDRQPLVDASEGARSVAVCAATVRSAREGRPVAVDKLLTDERG